jgi:hypothetical protein
MEDGLGFSLVPGSRPSSVNSASESRDARLELSAQALSGINQLQTLILVRKSTREHYDFIEKIALARKTPL